MRCPIATLVFLSLAIPAFSQDPVKVDPKHHKVEIDNAQVRVLRITFAPGDKTPPHDHPAGMAIFLTAAQTRVSPVGGAVNEDPRKPGDVVVIEAGKHTVENIGTNPVEIVLVELKNPPMKAWNGVARDAVKLDPKHYTVVGENDQARALRVHYGPNEKSVMHDHPPNVAVFLADGRVKMGTPDGKFTDNVGKRGAVQYSAGESHLPEVGPDGAVDVVIVELKAAAAASSPKP